MRNYNYYTMKLYPRHTLTIITETLDYIVAETKFYKISNNLTVHEENRERTRNTLLKNNEQTDPSIIDFATKQTIIDMSDEFSWWYTDKQWKIRRRQKIK